MQRAMGQVADYTFLSITIRQRTLIMVAIIILSLLASIHCWNFQADISALLASSLPPNLTDFSTAYNGMLNQLVIYSGISNGVYSTTTYIFNLTDQSLTKIQQTLDQVRFKACILAKQNQLYLFGGYRVNTTNETDEEEFWKLDLTTFQWSIVKSQLQPYRFCQMIYDNNSILIFGASFDQALDVFSYHPSTGTFQNLSILFFGACLYSVRQWDGSVVNLTVPIEDCPSEFVSREVAVPSFPMGHVKYLDIMDTGTSIHHVLQTQDNMYNYQYLPSNLTVVIRFFSKVDKQYGSIVSRSVKFNTWNIFCNWNIQDQNFYVTFVQRNLMSELRLTQQTTNFYSKNWPDFTQGFDDFCLILMQQTYNNLTDSFITLLIHGSLKVYTLHQNVFLNATLPPGLATTMFGLNQCLPGWTGPNCTLPICPNSLQLNAANGIAVIRLECSGHGECTSSGCVCDKLWGGSDCSVYLRSSCEGSLLDNFPLKNCECFNSTVGGNNCSVTFCPGDCFGHGNCVNGKCICDDNFYGADCSTMVVGFPR